MCTRGSSSEHADTGQVLFADRDNALVDLHKVDMLDVLIAAQLADTRRRHPPPMTSTFLIFSPSTAIGTCTIIS